VAAQNGGGAVSLAVTGRFPRGGEFIGTATINRFERRVNEAGAETIVAVGTLRGTLARGRGPVGSVLRNGVTWPVAVRTGGLEAVNGPGREPARIERTGWTLAQGGTCPIVQIALGPLDVNLLGVVVALDPIGLDLHAEMGTPLGGLVCAVLGLLGNVAGLVNLLNDILGLLTGLLGGLLPTL
jgi:hypothetical protein